MPIRIPDTLPATGVLESENIFVMTEHRAIHQDIRPLHVLILNLMPLKIETETQILRKLSNTPLQIEIDLLQTVTHRSSHVPADHLKSFYVGLEDIRDKHYDGMIITGAPVEKMVFEDVDYWPELCEIFEWAKTNVFSTLYLCWGAQAGIYYHYGVQKHMRPEKLTGVFAHHILKPSSPLVRGLDDIIHSPHSRYTEVYAEDIAANQDLELISVSDEAGVFIAKSTNSRHFFVFGHPEYDTDTLANEYHRDVKKGLDPKMPKHYFPNDDPNKQPVSNWRAAAQLLYTNWLNYYVYQATPYDIKQVGTK
ncbi:MAG: homoserine O-succinyltransferase [Eggerthellaceae bacterium]